MEQMQIVRGSIRVAIGSEEFIPDTLCCYSNPGNDLIWKVKADHDTFFGIYPLENDFIIHGEINIYRIDENGNIKWEWAGRDIWVTINGMSPFEMKKDHIILQDFGNYIYEL